MSTTPSIERDGPGDLKWGDTLTLKAIRRYGTTHPDYDVSFDAFGSQIDISVEDEIDCINLTIQHSSRNLSKAQSDYIKGIAFLFAGMDAGWLE